MVVQEEVTIQSAAVEIHDMKQPADGQNELFYSAS